MLADFKNLYTIHTWLRFMIWSGLLILAFFMLWAEGGFPAESWRFFGQMLVHIPQQWRIHGAGAAFSLLKPAVESLFWLCVWGGLLWITMVLRHYHRSMHSAQVQVRPDKWISSSQLSLAVSGGQAVINDPFSTAIPRLRLPQRSGQPEVGPASSIKKVSPSFLRAAIQDIPTRPALPDPPSRADVGSFSIQPLQVGMGWNAGIIRQNEPNEDSMVVLQATCTYQGQLVPFGLFVIADGMGGHEHGQVASRIAIQHMLHTVLQNIIMGNDLSDEFLSDMLIGGVEWGNLSIYHQAQAAGRSMGTTLTAALVVGRKAYVVNVGDSRTYIFREREGLKPITRDHSLVASLVTLGHIKPEEVYTHPERNKVYRNLGSAEDVKVDLFILDLYAYDRLLLCSDGLWEMVRDPALERLLRSSDDVALISDSMVQAALRSGGGDNVSVILVQMPASSTRGRSIAQ